MQRRIAILLCSFALTLLCPLCPVYAGDSTHDSGAASAGSLAAVSIAPASVVAVSAYAGGTMIVESVRFIGETVEVVLRGAGNASRAVVTVSASAAKNVSVAAGQTVKVVAEAGGYLLVSAGRVLCFIPDRADDSLLHSQSSR